MYLYITHYQINKIYIYKCQVFLCSSYNSIIYTECPRYYIYLEYVLFHSITTIILSYTISGKSKNTQVVHHDSGIKVISHGQNIPLYLLGNRGKNMKTLAKLIRHIVALLTLNNVLKSHHLVELFLFFLSVFFRHLDNITDNAPRYELLPTSLKLVSRHVEPNHLLSWLPQHGLDIFVGHRLEPIRNSQRQESGFSFQFMENNHDSSVTKSVSFELILKSAGNFGLWQLVPNLFSGRWCIVSGLICSSVLASWLHWRGGVLLLNNVVLALYFDKTCLLNAFNAFITDILPAFGT